MKIIAFLLILVFVVNLHAQNLVKNPKFEEYSHLPDLIYEYGERHQESFICKYWHKIKYTTPDYCHINASHKRYGVPNNDWGFHPAMSDSAYVGFVPFSPTGAIEPIT